MVFYFSGTGNSLWVAKALGKAFNEPLISIADELKREEKALHYSINADEKVFFVYPVHSWGPAVLVQRFIKRLSLSGYSNQAIYSVCTCGDECGYTSDMIRKSLGSANLLLTAAYSITMPNNYILMKGFDVDPQEVEKEKLAKAPERIEEIINDIKQDRHSEIYQTGTYPGLKSHLIYPLFKGVVIRRNSFEAMDVCTKCGLCARVCPTGCITMKDGYPEWGSNCVQCTACIHRCPSRAIEYGPLTWKKGRYKHPEL